MTGSAGAKHGRPKPAVALVTEALQQAAQDAVEAHRQADQPLVVWKDGKTVLVSPQSVASAGQSPKPRRRKKS